jgi:hypothetical protein
MCITVFRFVYKSVFVVNLFLAATLLPFSGMAINQRGVFFAKMAVRYSLICFGFSLIAPLIVLWSRAMIWWMACEKRPFFLPELRVIRLLYPTAFFAFIGLIVALACEDPLDGIIGVLVLSIFELIAAFSESPMALLGLLGLSLCGCGIQKNPLPDEEKTNSNQDVPLTDTQQG